MNLKIKIAFIVFDEQILHIWLLFVQIEFHLLLTKL